MEQQLFDVKAAVEFMRSLGAGAASPCFVRGLINSGEVPHLKIGKKFYVSRQAIETWITRRERRRS